MVIMDIACGLCLSQYNTLPAHAGNRFCFCLSVAAQELVRKTESLFGDVQINCILGEFYAVHESEFEQSCVTVLSLLNTIGFSQFVQTIDYKVNCWKQERVP